MAGTPTPEPKPNLGWKATVAALVFSVTVLTGFGVATATNHEDNFDHSDEVSHDDDHADESHEGDDHAEDDHAEGDDHE